jgi:hypothetical protein
MKASYLNTVNRENIGIRLFDFMLEQIGKTRVNVIDNDKWRKEWSLTRNQYDILRDHSLKECKKVFKYRKSKAEATFEWFYHEFGLKIKN